MALSECAVCGDVFNYPIKMDICPECQMDLADVEDDEEDDEEDND